MLWARIKYYLYAGVMFIITALGVYVKILREQKEGLENEIDNKEREIAGREGQIEEVEDAREHENKQNDIIQDAEIEKGKVPNSVKDTLDKSETEDVKVNL